MCGAVLPPLQDPNLRPVVPEQVVAEVALGPVWLPQVVEVVLA